MTTPLWLRQTGRIFKSNSPTILSGVAVAGVAVTVFLAIKATPKAEREIGDAYAEKKLTGEKETDPELTRLEIAQATWKVYVPTAVSGFATMACIIGANQIGLRRNAALLGAYTLADTAFREYKEEVVAQLGNAKARKIHDEVAKKQIENHPVTDGQVIITGGGEQLCYDSLTGRYFRSDIEKIRQAQNEINRRMVGGDMYASLNEFYALLGLASTVVGDELGFNLDHFVDIVFTSHLSEENGTPCLAVGWAKLPVADYGKF